MKKLDFLLGLLWSAGALANPEFDRFCPRTEEQELIDSTWVSISCNKSWSGLSAVINHVGSPRQCAVHCIQDPACTSSVWDSKANNCWLSRTDPARGYSIPVAGTIFLQPGEKIEEPIAPPPPQPDCAEVEQACAQTTARLAAEKQQCRNAKAIVKQELAVLIAAHAALQANFTQLQVTERECQGQLEALNPGAGEEPQEPESEPETPPETPGPDVAAYCPTHNNQEIWYGGRKWLVRCNWHLGGPHTATRIGNHNLSYCQQRCVAKQGCIGAQWGPRGGEYGHPGNYLCWFYTESDRIEEGNFNKNADSISLVA